MRFRGEMLSRKTLLPFSIDVIREKNAIIVSNFSAYDLILRSMEIPSRNIRAFLMKEKMRLPISMRVKVVEEGGKCHEIVRLSKRS